MSLRVLQAIEGLDRASGVATFVAETTAEFVRDGHTAAVAFVKTDECEFPASVLKLPGTALGALPWRPDIVHLHGFWSRFSLRVLLWCLRRRVPFVVSPHGGLMPRVFTRGRMKKRLVWTLLLRPLLRRARAIHCTTETEAEACRRAGLRGPFAIAPLGVRLPPPAPRGETGERPFVVLFLGRLSEEKGLMTLLDAWRRLKKDGRPARLVLAGPDWRGYRAGLEAKIAAEGIEGVSFAGPVAGAAKDALYAGADLFVLPSPMENFSMVVLDALAWGLPVVATRGTPWECLETEDLGWWIDARADALAEAIEKARALSGGRLRERAARARAYVASRFDWTASSRRLLAAYRARPEGGTDR